jgi:2-hydroxychromene-2-carboxylate isomerase
MNMAPPIAHPFNPLTALRVSGAVDDLELRTRVIDALYMAVWTKRTAIDTPEAVASVLNDAGLDGAKLTAIASTQEAKDRLRANTDAALLNNVFGVPTIIVDSELFWGTDTLIDVESFLKGDLPSFSDAEWEKIPRAADRKAVKS